MLTAFREVSDALITRQKYAEAGVFDAQAVAALASSVDLATERYLNGKSSYYEVLQAQQELYPTQRTQVQTQVSELLSVVQLYKALGGGWQTPAAAAAAPAGGPLTMSHQLSQRKLRRSGTSIPPAGWAKSSSA